MERRRQQKDKKIKINLSFEEALGILTDSPKQKKVHSTNASGLSTDMSDGDTQMKSSGVYDN